MEITEDTRKCWMEIIKMKDNGNGFLGLEELETCCFMLGLNPDGKSLQFLKDHFDANGDGRLSIDELVNNLEVVIEHSVNGKQLMEAFETIDKNGDGYIRIPELLHILTFNKEFTVPEARTLITHLVKNYDINKDGKFDYSEFVKMFQEDEYPFKSRGGKARPIIETTLSDHEDEEK